MTYFVTFRHRRVLVEKERNLLFAQLLKTNLGKLDIIALVVLPERTELLCTVTGTHRGETAELSDIVEKAKKRAGQAIIKQSGERYPPFFFESYDRIMRDEDELQQFWEQIVDGPVGEALTDDPDDYETLYVSGTPDGPRP